MLLEIVKTDFIDIVSASILISNSEYSKTGTEYRKQIVFA